MADASEANVRPKNFKYQALDPSLHEVRVFDVGPGLVHDPLVATVRHVSLAANPKPKYEAVSYVWGDSSLREHVMLDGRWVDVPSSSAEALRNLRFQYASRTLWIDAICIDQDNVRERNHQVSLMGVVYSSTQRTLVWLGEADEETNLAFRQVDYFLREMMDNTANLTDLVGRIIDERGTLLVSEAAEYPTEEAALIIRAIYGRPWFRRLWVIQEAALAPECICFCGTITRPILHVLRIAVWFAHKSKFRQSDATTKQHAQNAIEIWRAVDRQHQPRTTSKGRTKGRTLETVLGRKYIGFQATDPRDVIYALLGLASRWPAFRLPTLLNPDYNKPLVDVFRDATMAFIEHDKTLWPFRHVNHLRSDDMDDLDTEWPSWVPRLDRGFICAPLMMDHVPFFATRGSNQRVEAWRRADVPDTLL